jgi:hypothetical protein
MGDCDNPDMFIKLQVEHGIGKTPDQTPADALIIMRRKRLRMLLNAPNGTLDFRLEVRAQSFPPALRNMPPKPAFQSLHPDER